jgi:hypothetical protein
VLLVLSSLPPPQTKKILAPAAATMARLLLPLPFAAAAAAPASSSIHLAASRLRVPAVSGTPHSSLSGCYPSIFGEGGAFVVDVTFSYRLLFQSRGARASSGEGWRG